MDLKRIMADIGVKRILLRILQHGLLYDATMLYKKR